MAKPSWAGLKTRPTLVDLVFQVVSDLARYLPEEKAALALLKLAQSSEREAFEHLRQELRLAESLASTGFLELAAWRQIVAIFDKNIDAAGTSAQSRKDNALKKFHASEMKCKRTNKRLAFYSYHQDRMSPDIQRLVRRARYYIRNILGPLGHLQLIQIAESSGFGPGFTFLSDDNDHKNLYYKVSSDHSVTEDAIPYLKFWMNYWPHWKSVLRESDPGYEVVNGNRVTTVPKNSETDRTIAIEPSFNVFMQKGVDAYLKKRLLRFGVNLHNQEHNHAPARVGSMRPLHAATIDLSSASDCVSTGVIDFLLPYEWVVLLDDLRSKNYTLDKGKTWQRYEKFSSMGNAFTFPIETILFYALAKACVVDAGEDESVLRVYGDDIIIPPGAYCSLVELLKFLGFSPNPEKSFSFGYFRETCGSDFYAGVDLRPVYVKCIPRDAMQVCNLHNRLIWNRVGFRFHRTCAYLRGLMRKVLYGPAHLPAGKEFESWYAGKSVIHDHWLHAPPDVGRKFLVNDPDWGTTYKFRGFRLKPKHLDTSNWKLQFWYLAFLLGVPGTHVESNSRFRWIMSTEKVSSWPDMPWRPSYHDS